MDKKGKDIFIFLTGLFIANLASVYFVLWTDDGFMENKLFVGSVLVIDTLLALLKLLKL